MLKCLHLCCCMVEMNTWIAQVLSRAYCRKVLRFSRASNFLGRGLHILLSKGNHGRVEAYDVCKHPPPWQGEANLGSATLDSDDCGAISPRNNNGLCQIEPLASECVVGANAARTDMVKAGETKAAMAIERAAGTAMAGAEVAGAYVTCTGMAKADVASEDLASARVA